MTTNEKTLEELAREERLAYFREWRANNKDKIKKHTEDYWKRKVEKRLSAEKGQSNETN